MTGNESRPPTVSVIMSVYNGETYLKDAVDSVLGQTYGDLEFIVINDGSEDKTADILASYGDCRMHVVHQENRGLTKALNVALKHARGRYVARQDADDISAPDRLGKQVSFMESRQDVALAGSWALLIDEEGDVIGRLRYVTEPADICERIVNENPYAHGSIIARREALDEVGGYREKFRYAQDYDLLLRMSERRKIANIPEELYYLRHRADRVSIEKQGEQMAFAELARELAKKRRKGQADELEKGIAIETLMKSGHEIDRFHYEKLTIYFCMREGNLKKARKAIIRMLKANPLQPRYYMHLALTFTGRKVSRTVLRLWEKMRYGR